MLFSLVFFFFFKQKTAYEMRISDWSSDVCSSDLRQYKRIALFTGQITNGDERHQIVEDWAAERIDIVVATSAFGMGVDKTNVRTVVHACLPEGPSRWYQEIGRAAREGHQGLAVCLFTRDERGKTRNRSEESREGKECGRTCRARWVP